MFSSAEIWEDMVEAQSLAVEYHDPSGYTVITRQGRAETLTASERNAARRAAYVPRSYREPRWYDTATDVIPVHIGRLVGLFRRHT